MSAFGGKADIAQTHCDVCCLTQSGHQMPLSASAATQLTCRLLGAIHTFHELMVKTSNQGDNHDAMSVQDTTASGGISGR